MSTQQNVTAIIYDKKGKILSIGKNSYIKTHPLQAHYANKVGRRHNVFLHAEIHAITRCRDLDKAHRIFVSRVDKKGKMMLAKPCQVCAEALRDATSIKHIEYTV